MHRKLYQSINLDFRSYVLREVELRLLKVPLRLACRCDFLE